MIPSRTMSRLPTPRHSRKHTHTPFLAKVAEHLDDDEATGELASTANSVLMKLMGISRLA